MCVCVCVCEIEEKAKAKERHQKRESERIVRSKEKRTMSVDDYLVGGRRWCRLWWWSRSHGWRLSAVG